MIALLKDAREGSVMWEWLQGLSGGAATFIGSLTGSSIGLVALLFGALFNAHLNRRRDDRIRREEARGIAAAARAELAGIIATLERNANELQDPKSNFLVPDLAHSLRIIPEVAPKLVLLDGEAIRGIVDAQIMIDQYCEQLLVRGGTLCEQFPSHRRIIRMPVQNAGIVIEINKQLVAHIRAAIQRLEPYLH